MFENLDILRQVNRLGARGRKFQYRELRQALGVDASEKLTSASVYNYLTELRNTGIVAIDEESPRERHKYFRIEDEQRLTERIQDEEKLRKPMLVAVPSDGAGNAVAGGSGRISRLEEQVRALRENVEEQFRDVRSDLESIQRQLNELVAAWS